MPVKPTLIQKRPGVSVLMRIQIPTAPAKGNPVKAQPQKSGSGDAAEASTASAEGNALKRAVCVASHSDNDELRSHLDLAGEPAEGQAQSSLTYGLTVSAPLPAPPIQRYIQPQVLYKAHSAPRNLPVCLPGSHAGDLALGSTEKHILVCSVGAWIPVGRW